MAPEIEVSPYQFRTIREWIRENSGEEVVVGTPQVIKGESITLKVFSMHGPVEASVNPTQIYMLECGAGIAKELDQAGVISFQEAEVTES